MFLPRTPGGNGFCEPLALPNTQHSPVRQPLRRSATNLASHSVQLKGREQVETARLQAIRRRIIHAEPMDMDKKLNPIQILTQHALQGQAATMAIGHGY